MDLEQTEYREYMYMEEKWLYWYFSLHRRESLSSYLLFLAKNIPEPILRPKLYLLDDV